MAINFPEGTASYSFKSPQQYAMHLRLTPEVKEALLKSQQNGETASLRLTGTGLDNVGHVIADSHASQAPCHLRQRLTAGYHCWTSKFRVTSTCSSGAT